MEKIKTIIKISRPVNFLIAFFAVTISYFISSSKPVHLIELILAALAMSFSFAAGNVINDIIDLEIDKINKPGRVLPKGDLTLNFAKILYIIFIVLSLVFSASFGIFSILFLASVNVILFFYSVYLKKIILVGNFVVALITASALIYGAFVSGNIAGGVIPAVFAFLINFIREIIKDMEDIKGDISKNVITFPSKFGIKHSLALILFLTVSTIILTIIPFVFKIYKIEFFIIVMCSVNVLFIYMLKLLYQSQALQTLKKVSSLVKLNMMIGLIAILLGK
ncbi:MAG TPA: UbiA family prenyltransferase [Ignavibacteriaceae bacterium]|nr:UbiA family prenyltransferase [Ignavibacteriaceae bacterium]